MPRHSKSLVTTASIAVVIVLTIGASASAQTQDWTSADVGAVSLAGSASESNGVWTVNGDGSDIWGHGPSEHECRWRRPLADWR